MKSMTWAFLPALLLALPAAAANPQDEQKPAATVTEPEPAPVCKKKKKGLGGLLRAARSSGLVSVVAGKAGTGGALVNSVANTAIDVADAGNRMAPPAEKPKC